MNIAGHHAGSARRLVAIALGIAFLASCGGSDAATDVGSDVPTDVSTDGGVGSSEPSTDAVSDDGVASESSVDVATTVPAPAELPATTAENTSPPVAEPVSVCTGGVYADDVVPLDGETLASLASRVGRTEADLQLTNQFGTNGRPEFGSSSDAVIVPCVENWPQNTTFFEQIDPATCEVENYALRGLYTVQSGQDAAAIADQIDITLDRLTVVNPDTDLNRIQAGDLIGVCQNWFS